MMFLRRTILRIMGSHSGDASIIADGNQSKPEVERKDDNRISSLQRYSEGKFPGKSTLEASSSSPAVLVSDGESSVSRLHYVASPGKGCLSRTTSSFAECRVCQQEKEEALMYLGCKCKGSLARAHRSCVDTWFGRRGSNKCEICQDGDRKGISS
ncbi:hypothetical protein Tsubulata_036153 [Turnera subulata]|uniref:RING-CH-type domain-containing protein n=1 Tax=Turnera subulata TaxID=218843 RepID=A0A9Q0JPW4_9ROSI|nr:hypothetical protein Tsubulata_036153 [Turnera subulata]